MKNVNKQLTSLQNCKQTADIIHNQRFDKSAVATEEYRNF